MRDGRARRLRAGFRAEMRGSARSHRGRQRRWRGPPEGENVLPAVRRRRPAQPPGHRRVASTRHGKRKGSSRACGRARSTGACSSAWGSSIRNAVTNEDAELDQRILESGGRVYLSRDIVAHYYPRSRCARSRGSTSSTGRGARERSSSTASCRSLRPALPFLGLVGEAFAAGGRAPWHVGACRSRPTRSRPAPKRCAWPPRGARGHPGRVGDLPRAPRLARRWIRGRAREVPRPPGLAGLRAPRRGQRASRHPRGLVGDATPACGLQPESRCLVRTET